MSNHDPAARASIAQAFARLAFGGDAVSALPGIIEKAPAPGQQPTSKAAVGAALAQLVGLGGLVPEPVAPAKTPDAEATKKPKKTPEEKAAKAERKAAKRARERDTEAAKMMSEVRAVDFQLADFMARSKKARRKAQP